MPNVTKTKKEYYMNPIKKALRFATYKHKDQKRKYTGEAYIVHPIEVANIVSTVTHTQDMLIAAILHDTVEDTITTFEEIEEEFGIVVREFVQGLTDVSKPEDGNRATRKALDRVHLSKQTSFVKTIKLADLICNTKSIVKYDPKFAKVYLAEKRLLLPVLKEGDKKLWSIAYSKAYGNK